MADVSFFENALGSLHGARTAAPPAAAMDTARFNRHRTIFISDTHLGTRGCKAEALADFLMHNDCETLFLVGDIVDGWQLRRRWYWTEAQNHVVAQILSKVDAGTRVIFVPGNHDEFARDYAGRLFGGIEVINEAIHETADGKRLWVLHGDRFDGVIAYAKWLAHVGDWAYGMALRFNDMLFAVRKKLGLPYWSLSAWLKHKVKNAVEYISRFEEIVAREAETRGVDGVVCGHIHHAEIRQIGGVLYLNDGDWVESCSALVEDAHGAMEILRWADPSQRHAARASEAFRGIFRLLPPAKPRLYPRRAHRLEPGPIPGVAAHLKIMIVTDAWSPQVNGVVRTLETLGKDLGALGHTVRYITPLGRRTFPLPTYPEIRLALFQRSSLTREIKDFAPDAVHIATEGSLGLTARRICLKHGIAFTTAFHTRFAEYVHARFRMVPERVIWRWLRWFHHPATAVMVATQTLKRELAEHGFKHLRIWSRGVDIEKFHPVPGHRLPYEGPIWIYVGRVAVEKNIEAFLALDIPGTKVVVGDGPAKGALSQKYPAVKFLGSLTGEPLTRAYAGSDVFVFPSRTDTFGLVTLEALACGLTVAAYPVEGPLDVVGPDVPGGKDVAVLDEDLRTACLGALALRQGPQATSPRVFAESHSWRACTLQFLGNIAVEPDLPQ